MKKKWNWRTFWFVTIIVLTLANLGLLILNIVRKDYPYVVISSFGLLAAGWGLAITIGARNDGWK